MLSRINKELVPLKAHYFMWNAGTAPVVPFLSTYSRQLGFSSVIVGLIYTILPISGMVAKPLFGAIADRFKCQKLIFLLSQLVTALAFLAIFYSPEIPLVKKVVFACDGKSVFDTSTRGNDSSVDECLITQLQSESGSVECRLDCNMKEDYWNIVINSWNADLYSKAHPDRLKFTAFVNKSGIDSFDGALDYIIFPIDKEVVLEDGKKYAAVCPNCPATTCAIRTICNVDCSDYNLNDLIVKPSITDDEAYEMSQFWIFLVLMVVAWVAQSISVSVGDAICFEMLGDKPNRYGYQRMFGALGWGILAPIAGVMVDSLSEGSSYKNLQSAFYLAAGFLVVDFFVSSRIKYVQKKNSSSIFRDVGGLLKDVRILVFMTWCIAVGMCTGLMWNFLFFLVEDVARNQGCDSQRWIKTLEGLIMGVQTLAGEMPFFFWSGKILKRIGHVYAMTLVTLAIGLRYILYSVIPNPWWFLPLEVSNGITFGLFYACMASYASIVAPPGTEATVQGLVGATFEGIGVSLGSFVAGLLYFDHGGPMTFRIFGIGILIFSLVHAGVQYLIRGAEYSAPTDNFDIYEDEDEQELTPVQT